MELGISETEYYRQHQRGLAALAALIGIARPGPAAPARTRPRSSTSRASRGTTTC
jgi:hypothetical protein